ncbi:uncharacterized protein LOC109489013 isoform X2 [Ailuropoda melanoleuca]|uniref:uncharacterized protein LOC109489013 isoform X2 n=1 Tax=Ailuropoda melanoleuca TaxID=9646 RepID=UPI00149446E6|nr:uncharacterized protein LOC109489013 isoform X2 [Ailuropoda melanoleuca]XP_034517927.1 uncharacterized protein LOC109489013 isoform X2 [Ailuropoda melanoleuca]
MSIAERHRRAPAAGCFLNYGCGAIAGAGQASPSRVHSLAGTGRGDSIEPTVQRAPGERQPAWWLRERLVGDHRSNASERPPWFSRGTNMEAQNGGPTPRALEGWEFSGTANHPANCSKYFYQGCSAQLQMRRVWGRAEPSMHNLPTNVTEVCSCNDRWVFTSTERPGHFLLTDVNSLEHSIQPLGGSISAWASHTASWFNDVNSLSL